MYHILINHHFVYTTKLQPVSFSFPIREVDKVLSGLEILSKVFDQQSAIMVSKMIQQVQLCV